MTVDVRSHPHGHAAAHPEEKPHPKARHYVVIASTLTVITLFEIAIFYIEPIRESVIFVPLLLFLSAVKFALVVMFYMHLKFDARLFSGLFVGPLLIAAGVVVSLLFLFGQLLLG